jgi:hypothetical protein
MDVATPVTLDVPETVTFIIPKKIVLDRNRLIGVVVVTVGVVVAARAVKVIRTRRQIHQANENNPPFAYTVGPLTDLDEFNSQP